MGVQRLQPAATVIRMAQLEHIAIAVGIPLGALAVPAVCDCNRAGLRSVHGRADCRTKVQRPVQRAIIVQPSGGDYMALQGPAEKHIFISQVSFFCFPFFFHEVTCLCIPPKLRKKLTLCGSIKVFTFEPVKSRVQKVESDCKCAAQAGYTIRVLHF